MSTRRGPPLKTATPSSFYAPGTGTLALRRGVVGAMTSLRLLTGPAAARVCARFRQRGAEVAGLMVGDGSTAMTAAEAAAP